MQFCYILVLFVPKDAVFGVVTVSVCLSVCPWQLHHSQVSTSVFCRQLF